MVRKYSLAKVPRARSAGVRALDVNEQLCSKQECPIKLDGDWIYGASGHLTEAFTTAQENSIREFLDALVSSKD